VPTATFTGFRTQKSIKSPGPFPVAIGVQERQSFERLTSFPC
jgi:hypothetical protein